MLLTTRAVRRHLDFSRPVPRALVERCLEFATQAPTGSNRQGWHFVMVEAEEKRRAIADLYRTSWYAYAQAPRPTYPEGDVRSQRMAAVVSSAQYLADNLHRAPLLLIPCYWGRPGSTVAGQAALFGSILPALWSFMLGARLYGLGTAWTTLHLVYEQEAAAILGIPYEKVTQAALTPVAFSLKTDFKPAPRIPLETVCHWDTW